MGGSLTRWVCLFSVASQLLAGAACSGEASPTPASSPTPAGGTSTETATPSGAPTPTSGGGDDLDHDGYTLEQGDCDDGDPARHPGAAEGRSLGGGHVEVDGVDNNCNNLVDDGTDAFDDDRDGRSELEGDCDDQDGSRHPGARELCDGRDDDCNGRADDVAEGICAHGTTECARVRSATPCSADSECGEGALCSEGVCYVAECDVNPSSALGAQGHSEGDLYTCDVEGDCPQGSRCADGVCAADCDVDADCGDAGFCTPSGRCGECAVDLDCASGRICSLDNRCELPECQRHQDCEADEFCDLDQRCEASEPRADVDLPALGIRFVSCEAPEHAVSEVIFGRGDDAAQVCLTLTEREGGSSAAPAGPVRVALGTLSMESAIRPDAAASRLSLDIPQGEVSYDDDLGIWQVSLAFEVPIAIGIHLDDDTDLGAEGAAPVLRAASEVGGASLNVVIPGGWGGGYSGSLSYEQGTRSAMPFSMLIDPSTAPVHTLVLLSEAHPLLGEDLRGTFTEGGDPGSFTARWVQTLDLGALGAALGASQMAAPVVDRPLYREVVLTGQDLGGGVVGGTFVETLRGLSGRDLKSRGSFQMVPSNYLDILHADAIGDPDDPQWSAPTDASASFVIGGLDASVALSPTCAAYYAPKGNVLAAARCYTHGEGDACGFTTPAYQLGAYLQQLAGSSDGGSASWGDDRYVSRGLCDVELSLYGLAEPYGEGDTRPVAYERGMVGIDGACNDPGAAGTIFQLGDPGFKACCVDVNRLRCAAELYALDASLVGGAEGNHADFELYEPLAQLLDAHVYELQDRRFRGRSEEFTLQADGNPVLFSMEQRVFNREEAVAALAPAIQTLADPTFMAAFEALRPETVELCESLVDTPCPYYHLLTALASATGAYLDGLYELAEVWRDDAAGDPALTRRRMRWIAAATFVHMSLIDDLGGLTPGAGADPTFAALPEDVAQRLIENRGRAAKLHELTRQAIRDRNRWNLPSNYIPNPTTSKGDFAGRLQTAAEAVESSAQEEQRVLQTFGISEETREGEEAGLVARRGQALESLAELCGGSPTDPVSAEECGDRGQGALGAALAEVGQRIDAHALTELELGGIAERIRIKDGEAKATLAALDQLADTYAANLEDLKSGLEAIHDDYTSGWESRFHDYQDDKAQLYSDMEALYAGLAEDTRATLDEVRQERSQALATKCEAMKASIAAKRAAKLLAIQTKCDATVACLEEAERRKASSGGPFGLFKKAVKAVVKTFTGAGDAKECKESCRARTACDSDIKVEQAEAAGESEEAEYACMEEAEQLALDGREAISEQLWREESAQLQRMMAQGDERLRDWYDYREARMAFEMERQEQAALLAHQHADRQAGVRAQVEIARQGFMAEIQMMMVDLGEKSALLEQRYSEVEEAIEHAAALMDLAEALQGRIAELDRQIAGSAAEEPAFRLVESEAVADLADVFDAAKKKTWEALRAYEFETSMGFSQRDLLNRATTSDQLCDLLQCLRDNYDDYVEAFSDSTGGPSIVLSARQLLGLDEDLVNPATGDDLPAGARLGQFLTSQNQLVWDESNGLYTRGFSMQTHSQPGRPHNWDGQRCNEKIQSIQVMVLCEGCTRAETVRLRVTPGGTMTTHSCVSDAETTLYGSMANASKTATTNAKVVTLEDGETLADLREADWDAVPLNRELRGLGVFYPGWDIDLTPTGVLGANADLLPGLIDDIVVRINYEDQTNQAYGSVDFKEATCTFSSLTSYNRSSTYACGL